MKSRIALSTFALAALVGLSGFAPASGELRVYNISALNASVSVDGGPYKDLGNSDYSSTVVAVGRHVVTVRRRGLTTHHFQLVATNAYLSPQSGMHWCVRLGHGTADLLPVATCGDVVDNGG
jgi:hypothetical protein